MWSSGCFLPVGQGGFVMSTNRPPTPATYDHNREITMLAEDMGLGFVISLAQWRGSAAKASTARTFSNLSPRWPHWPKPPAEFGYSPRCTRWSITRRRQPRSFSTIDQISQGRFGLNLVAGSNPIDHGQLGLWRDLPHDEFVSGCHGVDYGRQAALDRGQGRLRRRLLRPGRLRFGPQAPPEARTRRSFVPPRRTAGCNSRCSIARLRW